MPHAPWQDSLHWSCVMGVTGLRRGFKRICDVIRFVNKKFLFEFKCETILITLYEERLKYQLKYLQESDSF